MEDEGGGGACTVGAHLKAADSDQCRGEGSIVAVNVGGDLACPLHLYSNLRHAPWPCSIRPLSLRPLHHQALVARSLRFGLWVMTAVLLYNSAVRGRMADIRSTCSGPQLPRIHTGSTPDLDPSLPSSTGRGGRWLPTSRWWSMPWSGRKSGEAAQGTVPHRQPTGHPAPHLPPSAQPAAETPPPLSSFVARALWRLLWGRYLPSSGSWGLLSSLGCYARETGSYAVGLAAAWYIVLPLLGGRSGGPSLPGQHGLHALLDVGLGLGLVGGAAGSYMVACLGGCWLAWLLLWLTWVGVAAGVLSWAEAEGQSPAAAAASSLEVWRGVNMVLLALFLPLAAGALPFCAQMHGMCEWAATVAAAYE